MRTRAKNVTQLKQKLPSNTGHTFSALDRTLETQLELMQKIHRDFYRNAEQREGTGLRDWVFRKKEIFVRARCGSGNSLPCFAAPVCY